MEEDIKKCEALLGSERWVLGTQDKKALENLIKGYKRVRAGRNWLSERISAQIATPELFDKILEEDYIPKSKIKEKIEELGFKTFGLGNQPELWEIKEQIKLLQELMEDK